jgi:hypothetical protein
LTKAAADKPDPAGSRRPAESRGSADARARAIDALASPEVDKEMQAVAKALPESKPWVTKNS